MCFFWFCFTLLLCESFLLGVLCCLMFIDILIYFIFRCNCCRDWISGMNIYIYIYVCVCVCVCVCCNILVIAPSNATIHKARESRVNTLPCEKEIEHTRHLWNNNCDRVEHTRKTCGLYSVQFNSIYFVHLIQKVVVTHRI